MKTTASIFFALFLISPSISFGEDPGKKFEYSVLDEATLLSDAKGNSKAEKLNSALNEKANSGWRLVAVQDEVAGFKTSSRVSGGSVPTDWTVQSSRIYFLEKVRE